MRVRHISSPENGLQHTETTDFSPQTALPDPEVHTCPLNRNCRSRCRAWKGSHRPGESKNELPAALRWFAKHHNWHEPGYLSNRLKLRLVFREPVLAVTHQLLARERDGLAERIRKDFKCLQKMIQPLDDTGIRQIDDENTLGAMEHTKATVAGRMNELADLIESGQKSARKIVDIAPTADNEQWVTYKEAAGLLGIKKSTVSKWVKKGRLTDNGEKGRKKRLSKNCVLLVKQEIDDEYLKNDAAELRNDARRIR